MEFSRKHLGVKKMFIYAQVETPTVCLMNYDTKETTLVNVYIPSSFISPKTGDVSKANAEKLNKYFASRPSVSELKKKGFDVFPCIKTGHYQIRSRGYFPMCQDLSKLIIKVGV
jgi:hypothetical protein